MGIALYTTLVAVISTIILRTYLFSILSKAYNKFNDFEEKLLWDIVKLDKNSNKKKEENNQASEFYEAGKKLLESMTEKYENILEENKKLTNRILGILEQNQAIMKDIFDNEKKN